MSTLAPHLATYLGSTALAVVFTPIAMRFATSFGIVDKLHARKVHRAPVPRIGGIAIGLAVLIALAFTLTLGNHQMFAGDGELTRVLTLLVGAASILIIGVVDDVQELSSKYKLVALVAAATCFCGAGGAIHSIVVDGETWLTLGIASWPVTILWIVGVTVSINFIDGLDGLAAGIVGIAAAVLAVGCGISGYPLGVVIALALCGGLSGFLVFNKHPAKVFMGDCGSMFIGFLLAATCVLASDSVSTTRSIILPAVALSIPLLDTLFTMIRRGVLQRRSLFAPERGHIHHRLLDIGMHHKHVVWLLYGITLACATVGIACMFAGSWAATIAAVAMGFCLLALFRIAGSVRARETLAAIRRNRAISREAGRYQAAFYDLQLRFREADTFATWWEQVCRAAEVLDFAKIDLPLMRRDGTTSTFRWRRDEEQLALDTSITAEVPVPQRRAQQAVRAQVEVLVSGFLESAGHRVALFSRLMAEFGLDQLGERTAKRAAIRSSAQPDAEALAIAAAAAAALRAKGQFPGLRVAIVHDFLYVYAGAERVLEQLVEIFPQADLFSLFDFLPENGRGFIQNKPVTASFLQRMPFAKTRHRVYLPLMPLAIEQLDVADYDLVISSSYVAAKGVITRSDQLHICYCHTPVRFAWDLQRQYLGQAGLSKGLKSIAAKVILHYIRGWDLRSANGVDAFVTNSNFVGRRIQKVYRRDATTVYPPVDIEHFTIQENKEDYYLTASRMVPYKRIDLIVEAFAQMPTRRLVVIGDGPEMNKIKAKATPNITFLGHETTERLRRHMQMAKAFVFAAEEDFGIMPVEAQACGTPVIAFGSGGVTESVIEGKTGLFFHTQSAEAIIDAVERFEKINWDAIDIRLNAERFSARQFREHFAERIRIEWEAFLGRNTAVGLSLPSNRDVRAGTPESHQPAKTENALNSASVQTP